MVVFPCHVCKTSLQAEDAQAGQQVRCPTCLTVLRVPTAQAAPAMAALAGVGAGAGSSSASTAAGGPRPGAVAAPQQRPASGFPGSARGGGKRYGFNCGYCSSRLEATEAMAAQEGQCPTCGNNITIPILDRYGRLIDPKTRQIIKQDPHPVHAYAAAGERAPAILRAKDGKQLIRCPRCQGASPISANNCKSCGMPFTMEGTTLEAAGSSNGFAVASLVLGIIGLPLGACIPFLVPALALTFGIIGYNQITRANAEGGGRGMAIAGMVMGGLGCVISVIFVGRLL